MAKKPAAKKPADRSKSAQKGWETRKYNADVARNTARREQFEADNPSRYQDLAGALGDKMRADQSLQTPLGMDREEWASRNENFSRSVGPGMTYHLMGWQGHDNDYVHPDQDALIEHPNTLDNPARWEELSKDQQDATIRGIAKYGVTPDSARRAYEVQFDRGTLREDGRHQNFYAEEGQDADGNNAPRSELKKSAAENNVPFHMQAVSNAITSPQNKFIQKNDETGEVRYPNNESATVSVKWASEGKTGDDYLYHPDHYVPPEDKIEKVNKKTGKVTRVKHPDDPRKYPAQGYPKNNAKAIDVVGELLTSGKSVREVWGASDTAQKVQPYYNAWVAPKDSEGQYHVNDIQSGGEGFAPHLSKDEQNEFLNVPGMKALGDHLVRDINRERGLVSVNRTQSQHWNQSKLEQGHNDVSVLTHSKKNPNIGTQFKAPEGQDTLF